VDELTIGSQVRKYRNKKAWTLSELGERAKLKGNTLSDIENDKCDPSIKSLRRVAEALEIEVACLFQTV